MPDVATNIIGAWACTARIVDIFAEEFIEAVTNEWAIGKGKKSRGDVRIFLEGADGFCEEASTNEEDEIRHDDQKYRECWRW